MTDHALQTYLPLGYGLLVGTLADVSSGEHRTYLPNNSPSQYLLRK